MTAPMLTVEEQAWLDGGERVQDNPIVLTFGQTLAATENGKTDPEDGLRTLEDVLSRWIDYMANGDQDVSWYPPIIEQANAYFAHYAQVNGVDYRPGMTKAVTTFGASSTLPQCEAQCEKTLNCCDCGGNECGCSYCWTCNVCEVCENI